MQSDETFRQAPAPFADPTGEDGMATGGTAPPLRVLIVEDDPFIAIDLEDTFTEAGFEVLGPYAHAKAAVEACRECVPDVATLDYRVSDGTSRPVAELLDRHDVPLVMVTGSREEMERRRLFREREVFGKPCDMDRLVDRARELATAG